MYLKLIFKRVEWNVPGCNGGFIDTLHVAPVVIDKLHESEKTDCFMPLRSLMHNTYPDTFAYYIDCDEMSKADILKAVHLFLAYYDVSQKGLPAVLSGLGPESNEIIFNMKVALANVIAPVEGWQQFQSENRIDSVSDMVSKLMC